MLRFDRLPRSSSLHTEAAGTAPPDAFGPFRVLHQLGAGTLGPVYRAYDPETDRLVAVKVFTLDLPPERVHQLVQEFERLVAAELNHPAIAVPVATGIVGASAYLAQEFVAAESLDLAIREYGPAPPADAVRVATQLAGALDFAAVVSVTHGAIHPRDVLLSAGETHLTGIGVAAALERVGVTAPIRRPYTAPERVAGRAWGRAADIFTLAALIHELLTGRRISGVGAQAPPSVGDVAGADVPALRAVFARALAEDPQERFSTALEFAEALKNALPDSTRRAPAAGPDAAVAASDASPRLPLSDPEPMPPIPVRAAEIDFPIAPVVDRGRPRDEHSLPIAANAERAGVGELDLRGAEETRYSDVEAAPAIVPAGPARTDQIARDITQPRRDEPVRPVAAAGAERSRGGAVGMIFMLIAGMLIGFGAGYIVGIRNRALQTNDSGLARTSGETTAPPQTTAPQGAREFTEGTVPPAANSQRQPATSTPTANAATMSTPAPDAGTQTPSVVAGQPDTRANAQAGTDARVQPTNEGRILVRSTPAGANVFVDGRDAGRTPVAVRDLARGTHRVRVALDGYGAEERRVAITRSRPAQSLTISLSPTRAASAPAVEPAAPATMDRYTGAVVVESRPSGADVYIDNRLMGRTPLRLDNLRAGEHVVRLEHDGYRRWSGQVRIIAAERTRVTASLDER